MTTFHRWDSGYISFTKGAPDVLLPRSESMLTSGGTCPLDTEEITNAQEKMASEGLRVLCIAMRKWEDLPEDMSPGNVETGLTLLGLTGMMDPPRQEAKEAVALCRSAGIHPGDDHRRPPHYCADYSPQT